MELIGRSLCQSRCVACQAGCHLSACLCLLYRCRKFCTASVDRQTDNALSQWQHSLLLPTGSRKQSGKREDKNNVLLIYKHACPLNVFLFTSLHLTYIFMLPLFHLSFFLNKSIIVCSDFKIDTENSQYS